MKDWFEFLRTFFMPCEVKLDTIVKDGVLEMEVDF